LPYFLLKKRFMPPLLIFTTYTLITVYSPHVLRDIITNLNVLLFKHVVNSEVVTENIKRMLGPGWVPGLRGRKDFFCTGEEKQADSRNLSSI